MVLEYMGFKIVQDEEDFRSVYVLKDDKRVMHLNVSKHFTEGELIEAVEACFKMCEKYRADDYIFGDEAYYNGDEPC